MPNQEERDQSLRSAIQSFHAGGTDHAGVDRPQSRIDTTDRPTQNSIRYAQCQSRPINERASAHTSNTWGPPHTQADAEAGGPYRHQYYTQDYHYTFQESSPPSHPQYPSFATQHNAQNRHYGGSNPSSSAGHSQYTGEYDPDYDRWQIRQNIWRHTGRYTPASTEEEHRAEVLDGIDGILHRGGLLSNPDLASHRSMNEGFRRRIRG